MKIKLYSTGRQTGDQTTKLVKERAAYFIYICEGPRAVEKKQTKGKKKKRKYTP